MLSFALTRSVRAAATIRLPSTASALASAVRYSSSNAVTKGQTPSTAGLPQAPNFDGVWSDTQSPRTVAMNGPRFEQTDFSTQPFAPAAIDLIAKTPVTFVEERVVACDGGGGALGHPKVYINLDDTRGPQDCGYCGLRFQMKPHHH